LKQWQKSGTADRNGAFPLSPVNSVHEIKRNISVFNSLSRATEEFTPVVKGRVGMYVCGPTVYNYIHIGNARPLIFFDVVRRYFEYLGYAVTYVQNITDIDDHIIEKSIDEGIPAAAVAEKYTRHFREDCERLGVRPPDYAPRATDYVDRMITLIDDLVRKEYAYEVDGNVFFEVGKFREYGRLSRKDLERMAVGDRVEESIQKQKRDPARDFALWKKAKPGEPQWDSPWGKGRPGWHTECVVMSTDILGRQFDIHGGGVDLVFPHHENEIAQARCSMDAPFARYWMHNEFLTMRGEKMAKSLGNVVLVRDLAERYSAEAIRLFFLQTHYRKPVSFDASLVKSAESAIERVDRIMQKISREIERLKSGASPVQPPQDSPGAPVREFRQKIETAMNDDFNTARAVGEFFNLVGYLDREADRTDAGHGDSSLLRHGRKALEECNAFFGILPKTADVDAADKEEIEILVRKRTEFRRSRDWESADRIRQKLLEMGVIIEDTPDGARWYRRA